MHHAKKVSGISLKKKLNIYDLHAVSQTDLGAAYIFCLSDIFHQIQKNYPNGIRTCVYLNGVQNLLSFESSADVLVGILKRARPFNACIYCEVRNMSDYMGTYGGESSMCCFSNIFELTKN